MKSAGTKVSDSRCKAVTELITFALTVAFLSFGIYFFTPAAKTYAPNQEQCETDKNSTINWCLRVYGALLVLEASPKDPEALATEALYILRPEWKEEAEFTERYRGTIVTEGPWRF